MRTGPLLAATLLLTLVMPIAQADEPTTILGEAMPRPDVLPAPEAPQPIAEAVAWLAEFPDAGEIGAEVVTPEQWAEFLMAVDAAVEETHPGVPRIGPLSPNVTIELLDGLTVVDRGYVEQFVALLPRTYVDPNAGNGSLIACPETQYCTAGFAPWARGGGVIAGRGQVGVEVAAVGPERKPGTVPVGVVPGVWYAIFNL